MAFARAIVCLQLERTGARAAPQARQLGRLDAAGRGTGEPLRDRLALALHLCTIFIVRFHEMRELASHFTAAGDAIAHLGDRLRDESELGRLVR